MVSTEGAGKVGKQSGGVISTSEATSAAERTEMQKTEPRPRSVRRGQPQLLSVYVVRNQPCTSGAVCSDTITVSEYRVEKWARARQNGSRTRKRRI